MTNVYTVQVKAQKFCYRTCSLACENERCIIYSEVVCHSCMCKLTIHVYPAISDH